MNVNKATTQSKPVENTPTQHQRFSAEERELIAKMEKRSGDRTKVDQLMRSLSTTTFSWGGYW